MKTPLVVVIGLLTVLPSFGQYSARRLTRKVAPQPAPTHQPVQPQPAPQQAPAAAPQAVYRAPATVLTPSAPADPAKVAAQKSKSERDLIEWQKQRAEAGSDNAQYELGMRYLTGNGVDQDEKIGREWIKKAAKNGNAQASKKLAELSESAPAAESKPATGAAVVVPSSTTPSAPVTPSATSTAVSTK